MIEFTGQAQSPVAVSTPKEQVAQPELSEYDVSAHKTQVVPRHVPSVQLGLSSMCS